MKNAILISFFSIFLAFTANAQPATVIPDAGATSATPVATAGLKAIHEKSIPVELDNVTVKQLIQLNSDLAKLQKLYEQRAQQLDNLLGIIYDENPKKHMPRDSIQLAGYEFQPENKKIIFKTSKH